MRFNWLALVVLLLPVPARADLRGCALHGAAGGGAFGLGCEALELCSEGDTCPDGTPCNPLSGVCLPECSTIIGCDDDSDCGSLRAGGACQTFVGGAGFDGGVCTAPDLPIQYCNATGPLSPERFLSCHTLPFSDTLTPSWFDGDCDGDGCPNASDGVPCVAGGACLRPSAIIPACERRLIGVGPERCVFPSEVPSCATAHDCAMPEDCPLGFGCDGGTCEPLECTAFYSCRTLDDCPDDTDLGPPIVCLPTELLDPSLGRGDGFCLFGSFDVTTECAELGDARSCFFRDGVFSNDFFQGDCDLDGCPNGLDPNPCSGDASDVCLPEGVSLACDTPIPPARPDAGVPEGDAAIPDSGVGLDAAGFDAAGFDAAGFDGGVDERVTFGGGGGCVCSAHRGSPPSSLALLALMLVLVPLRRARVTLLQKLAARGAWQAVRGRAR